MALFNCSGGSPALERSWLTCARMVARAVSKSPGIVAATMFCCGATAALVTKPVRTSRGIANRLRIFFIIGVLVFSFDQAKGHCG